jgi:uncharacterized protein YjdB
MTNHEEESRRLFEQMIPVLIGCGEGETNEIDFYWTIWESSRKTMPKIKLPVFADVYASGFGTANYAVDQCKLAIQEAGYEVEE